MGVSRSIPPRLRRPGDGMTPLRYRAASSSSCDARTGGVVHGQNPIHYAEPGEHVDDPAWKTVLAFFEAASSIPACRATPSTRRCSTPANSVRAATRRFPTHWPTRIAGLNYQAGYLLPLEPDYRKVVRGPTPQVVSSHAQALAARLDGRTGR